MTYRRRILPAYKSHRHQQRIEQAERLADKLLRTYCSPGVKHDYTNEVLHPDNPACYCYNRYCHRCGHTIAIRYQCHDV